jgi:hypothetical protein
MNQFVPSKLGFSHITREEVCTARNYPVVVTITIGFTKGRPLCIEYDRRWKTKLLLFSMKI